MRRLISRGVQSRFALIIAVVAIAGVVIGVTAIPIHDAFLEKHGPQRGLNSDQLSGYFGVAVMIALFASLLWLAATGYTRSYIGRPLEQISESVSRIVVSSDTLRDLPDTGIHDIDALVARINELIVAMRLRDETIDRHESMERKLREWMGMRKSYELELHEARLSAEDAYRIKSYFLASVSHELRTPLHTILSYARFGQRDALESKFDEMLEYFEMILDSGDYLLLLLNDLLDLSKLESGKMSFDMSPANLGDIVGCVLEHFQPRLREKQLRTIADLREPDLVFVDPSRTMQVVRNIMENAITYGPPESAILVTVSSANGVVTLRVQDRGPGVPKDELEAIFDSFRQSSEAKRDSGGAGLGLAICKQIMLSQKGRIWAERPPEGGLAILAEFDAFEEENAETGRESVSVQVSDWEAH